MMSGTSLDGLDLALTKLESRGATWSYELLATGAIPYHADLRNKLDGAIRLGAAALLEWHQAYGHWLGEQARDFLADKQLGADAVASHGHTVHHQPERGFTFQLGCPQKIALATALPTIGDFRSLDIALGGQGAPLVPVGDRLLFGDYDGCLNLGGISNLSFERDGERVAFDIGIANMLLNHISRAAGLDFDRDGLRARSGKCHEKLLAELNALEYYQKDIPKSTGYEWFRDAILPILDRHPDSLENRLHTATAHIAEQTGQTLRALLGPSSRVLVTGGGALNGYLMEQISAFAGHEIQIVIPERRLIEYKEALVFALLGALRLEGRSNVLASVTGAQRDSCSGVLYLP
jgi:anhydro-N-acetylmuramic acid kinase